MVLQEREYYTSVIFGHSSISYFIGCETLKKTDLLQVTDKFYLIKLYYEHCAMGRI